MAFLRPSTATAIAAALAFTSPSSSSSPSSPSSLFSNYNIPRHNLTKLSPISTLSFHHFCSPQKTLTTSPPSALHMDHPTSDYKPSLQKGEVLPELLTEFMVDMKCEGCVSAVKTKLETVDGVKNVEVDLSNQVVRVLGSSAVKIMTEALEQTGRKARLIGQGVPEDFLVSAAVAEFKGPNIFGVVRMAQVNMELARIEANFSGLPAGKYGWTINQYGDLTKGAVSTGTVFNPTTQDEPLGDLGTLVVDENGEAFYSGTKKGLKVSDLIGRSVAIYGTADKSDPGLTAAVIARSAGVGENYKKLCTCDGTTIWEASNANFVTSKL